MQTKAQRDRIDALRWQWLQTFIREKHRRVDTLRLADQRMRATRKDDGSVVIDFLD